VQRVLLAQQEQPLMILSLPPAYHANKVIMQQERVMRYAPPALVAPTPTLRVLLSVLTVARDHSKIRLAKLAVRCVPKVHSKLPRLPRRVLLVPNLPELLLLIGKVQSLIRNVTVPYLHLIVSKSITQLSDPLARE